MDDEGWKAFGFVLISSYRRRVVNSLSKHDMIPTGIAQDSGIRTNHISKVLRELKEGGVVECINEEASKGRLYRLTDLGNEIADNLK